MARDPVADAGVVVGVVRDAARVLVRQHRHEAVVGLGRDVVDHPEEALAVPPRDERPDAVRRDVGDGLPVVRRRLVVRAGGVDRGDLPVVELPVLHRVDVVGDVVEEGLRLAAEARVLRLRHADEVGERGVLRGRQVPGEDAMREERVHEVELRLEARCITR